MFYCAYIVIYLNPWNKNLLPKSCQQVGTVTSIAADSDKPHMLRNISRFNIGAVTRRDAVERAHVHVDRSPRLPTWVFLANGPSINFLQASLLFKDGRHARRLPSSKISPLLAVRTLFFPNDDTNISDRSPSLFVYLYIIIM